MSPFYAFTMRVGGRIQEIDGFETEAEADAFGIKTTNYHELDPRDPPDFYDRYDPPFVLLVEVDEFRQIENGKYKRPVAIDQRGEKWVCSRVKP